VPLALTCLLWPAADRDADTKFARLLALVVSLALWPERNYAIHYADNLAVACGLLGNLLLVRGASSRALWGAAALAAAAVACKQTAAGIALAQVVWLALTAGVPAGLRQIGRCAVAGAGIALLSIAVFGRAGLWFVLVELPAHFRWAPDPLERLGSVAGELALQVGLPLVVMLGARAVFRRREWLLPAAAWAGALPLGISALLKYGGRMNSVYAFTLWLPAIATLALTTAWPAPRRRSVAFAAATLAALVVCARIADAPRFFLRPQIDGYREAAQIAAQWRGQVWFPFHPLVTLYSEQRYYHDEDGLYVRRMTHKAVTPEHAASQLPPVFRAVAYHNGWTDFAIGRNFLPPDARTWPIGEWTVQIAGPNRPAP
jgi:hypothetical protein